MPHEGHSSLTAGSGTPGEWVRVAQAAKQPNTLKPEEAGGLQEIHYPHRVVPVVPSVTSTLRRPANCERSLVRPGMQEGS